MSTSQTADQSLEKRLRPVLFLCRLLTTFLFGAWGYGMIVRPAINSDQLAQYYHIPGLPNGVIIILGLIQLLIAISVLLGYQKRLTRGILLVLALLGAFMPKFLMGYWTGTIGLNTHPHLLTFTAFCLLGAASMIYIMRDEDTLWSVADRSGATVMSADVVAKLRLPLLMARIGIVMVFLAWTYDKIFNVRHGVRMFERYYKIPFDASMVQILGWAELVFVLVIALGLFKRLSRGALILFCTYTVLIPMQLAGYFNFLNPNFSEVHPIGSFDQFFLIQALAMPVVAIAIYALRDYDTLFSFSKKDRALKD